MGEENDDLTKPKGPSPSSSMTEAQFLSWKTRKDLEASARKEETAIKRAADIAAGVVQMNGRELFLHEPWVFDNNMY